ncbi:SDA1 domain protein [Apiospora hydei]|uniref:Protein SDA1 n=1 Tax=Apiospora hydei TaxID=1337664 RepID=A0ABR1XC15_9PEZI
MGRTALEKTEADLVTLQYKIRRDPQAYEKEFLELWNQYESTRDQFLAAPVTSESNVLISYRELVDLIAHCADRKLDSQPSVALHCIAAATLLLTRALLVYPEHTVGFADGLKETLTKHHAVLESDLREKIVTSLVLLRRKDVVDSGYLLTTLLPILVSTPSKSLRHLLFTKILSDLRNSNTKSINHKLNRTVQNALFTLVTSDRTSSKGLWAVKLTREMWRRQLWTDAKPVAIMKEACLSDNEKVMVGGVRFFLGSDQEREELQDESSDEETPDIKQVKHQIGINKKSKKKKKALDKAVDKVKRAQKKKNAPSPLNFSALHLLHDPQGFSEALFAKHLHGKSRLALESKLQVLQLITRLVGLHQLTLLSLYSWFTKHLTPRQQSVTTFLACLAQATHELVPPDVLEVLIQKIANEFVSEAAAAEVASAGLNAIREICARQPLAMTDTLLQDLVQYIKSKDKGVQMAARGLRSLYREQAAEMLQRKDRGKQATMNLKSGEQRQKKFGEQEVGGIEGLELLAKWKEDERKRKRAEKGLPEGGDANDEEEEEEEEDDGWEVASNESSDSGEWIRVSDSEDEDEPAPKKQKRDSEEPEDEGDAAKELEELSKLATTSILTPADLAKLRELRMEASIDKAMGNKKRKGDQQSRHFDEGLTAEQIEAPARLRKDTKEERIAKAKEGKGERSEHKSTQAIRKSKKDAEGKSTTNQEKARKKNFLMTLGKAKSKQKRSLVDTRNALKNHISRSKAGGRRRNGVAK